MAVLSFRRTFTGQRKGPTQISRSSTKGDAKSCIWGTVQAEANYLESSFVEKDLGVLVDKSKMDQQRVLQAKAANSTLSCIRQSILHRLREEVIFSLSLALVKHILTSMSSSGLPSTRGIWA